MGNWVDANAYWGRWGVRTPGVADVATLLGKMDRWNVEVAALTALRALVDNTRQGNRDVAQVIRTTPPPQPPAATVPPISS